MTTTTLERTTPSRRPPAGAPPVRRSRAGIAAVLIAGLLAAGFLRGVSSEFQARAAGSRAAATRGNFGNMNSYALALLLGGLRGPLVMFLWTTSENQKTDRDLEDLDTKIEWIRLLQPEFDTVHLFQMWNKAYNISVLMASPANKYTIIMEAIDYGNKVDQERSGDLNILQALGSIYQGKLSAKNLPESAFYTRQFREESLTDASRARAFPEDSKAFHRLSAMQPLLDGNDDIRPDLVLASRSRPAQIPAGSDWNDGSALQYLRKYGRFPYGIGPHAMAYNYAKRAQVAMASEGQKPVQLSPMVIDSQPGILLKSWAEDETYRGHELFARAFKMTVTGDLFKNGDELARIPVGGAIADRTALDGAMYSYALAAQLSRDAGVEFRRHIAQPIYAARIALYSSHLLDLVGIERISNADHDYAAASVATGEERVRLMKSSLANYEAARLSTERNVLQHYTESAVFTDPGFLPGYPDALKIVELPDAQVNDAFNRAIHIVQVKNYTEHSDERTDYGRLIVRCNIRIALLQKALSAGGA